MITLYLDMDGVFCNFDKAYRVYDPEKNDRKKFRSAVLDGKIFEDLEPMPNSSILLKHVQSLRNINVEMLTSMGTHDAEQGAEAKRQKLVWLKKHNFPFKPNFVRNKEEKAQYATKSAILLDDSPGCVVPFVQAGGKAILYQDKYVSDALAAIDQAILNIHHEHLLSTRQS